MSRCSWVKPETVISLEVQERVLQNFHGVDETPTVPDIGRLDRDRCPDTGIWKVLQRDGQVDFACDVHLPALLKDGADFFAFEIEECRAVIFGLHEEHQPSYVGPRKFGFMQCMVCGTRWPCLAVRAQAFVSALEPVYTDHAPQEEVQGA